MGKKYTKKEAVSIAISAARLYKDKLKYPDDWGSLPRLEAENNTGIDSTK